MTAEEKQYLEELEKMKPIYLFEHCDVIVENNGQKELNKEIIFAVDRPVPGTKDLTSKEIIEYDNYKEAWKWRARPWVTFSDYEVLDIFAYQLRMEEEAEEKYKMAKIQKDQEEQEKQEKILEEKRKQEEEKAARQAYENSIDSRIKEKWEKASDTKKSYYVNFNELAAGWTIVFFISFIITGSWFIRVGIAIHIVYGLIQQSEYEIFCKWLDENRDNLEWDLEEQCFKWKEK